MPQQQSKRKKVRTKAKSGVIKGTTGLVVKGVVVSPVKVLGQVGRLKEPDRVVLLEKYVRGRSANEIAELLKVKRRTITRRLRKAEERLGKALAELDDVAGKTTGESSVSQSASTAGNGSEWTKEKDGRRCQLIDREIENTLTPDERTELNQLQNEMLAYRRSVAPLPIEAARKLHAELMESLAKQ